MTPQERQLIDDLFDRIAKLEMGPRDPEAERAIAAGAQRAPHALYALVQTALVQDEALKQAEAHIRELTGAGAPAAGSGFLDSMRSALGRGSVPSVPQASGSAPDPRWNSGGALPQGSAPQYAPQAQPASPFNAAPQGGGGSFLGTAASTAAGVIGGSLLFNALGGMFGGHRGGSAFADAPREQGSGNPWSSGGDNAAGSDLSRDAGLNDVGGNNRSAGLFDDGDSDNAGDYDVADSGDDGDFGGGDSSDA